MKHRFFNSLLITVLLYATIGFLFFYTLIHTVGTEQKPKEKIINFTLSQYVPEVIPPAEPPIEELLKEEIVEPVVEKPIIEELEPEPIIEDVKPEPVVEKVVPKPIVKKIKKKRVKKVKKKKRVLKKKKYIAKKKRKKTKTKKNSKKKTNKKRSIKKRALSKAQESPAKTNRFLNQLRAKINRNKAYPRIAQRRGMQGTVKVRFTILKNGKVGNISVSGKKVFHKSAKSAVKKAFPMNVKNAPIALPETVSIILRYQIR